MKRRAAHAGPHVPEVDRVVARPADRRGRERPSVGRPGEAQDRPVSRRDDQRGPPVPPPHQDLPVARPRRELAPVRPPRQGQDAARVPAQDRRRGAVPPPQPDPPCPPSGTSPPTTRAVCRRATRRGGSRRHGDRGARRTGGSPGAPLVRRRGMRWRPDRRCRAEIRPRTCMPRRAAARRAPRPRSVRKRERIVGAPEPFYLARCRAVPPFQGIIRLSPWSGLTE